jgi:hypothetical protein
MLHELRENSLAKVHSSLSEIADNGKPSPATAFTPEKLSNRKILKPA